jgi:23S rRNA maturation-related 3'-5' exoribonuclease YhaM
VKESGTNELKAGHEVTAFFTVRSMERRKSRNNRDYLVFELIRDSDAIKGYLWGAIGMGSKIRPGCCVKVKGHVKNLNNVNLIEIKQIWPATESDMNANDIVYYRKLVARRVGERTRQLSLWPDKEEDQV